MRYVGALLGCLLALWLAGVPNAAATLPGPNGKIAFTSDRNGPLDVWSMNADGTAQIFLQSDGVEDRFTPDPAWDPTGREIAFAHEHNPSGENRADLYVMEADGGNLRPLGQGNGNDSEPTWAPDSGRVALSVGLSTGSSIEIRDVKTFEDPVFVPHDLTYDRNPDWSPDGHTIVFDRFTYSCNTHGVPSCVYYASLWTVDPDVFQAQPVALTTVPNVLDEDPSISPDGTTVVFTSDRADPGNRLDLYTVPLAGGTPTQLTDTPTFDETQPVWSPDGTKIAFTGQERSATNWDVFKVDANGTGRVQLTTDPADDSQPSWQRIVPAPGYPRPKGATPLRVSLVPAFNRCESPNRTHGPPLAFGSCSPPEQASSFVTVGTPDANGFPSNMTGFLRLDAILGNPSTPADEADIGIRLHVTDVRYKGDPSLDYPYRLFSPLSMQLTDKDNGCCGFPSTMRDGVSLYTEAPCTTTADPNVGSTCDVTTTADAFIPGMVRESQREVWQMRGPVQVFDFGPDASGADATLFLTQGVFVP